MRQLLRITATFALALVFSAGMAFGQSQEAVVEQIDNSNEATVNQTGGPFNAADVNQGVDQEANVTANNLLGGDFTGEIGSGTATNNEVTVDQAGDRNVALVSQGYAGNFNGQRSGVARRNVATVEQSGTGNEALPGQGLRGGVATDNEFTITQDGMNNDAVVAQGINTGRAFDNEANVEQFGSENTARINQGVPSEVTFGGFQSNDSLAEIFQDGTSNEATINQSD